MPVVTAVLPAQTRQEQSKRARKWLRNTLRKCKLAGKTAFTRAGNGAKPVLVNLASIPLTVAGFGCLAGAAWWYQPVVGLFSAGVLLIVLELMIADEA